ncbi:MAG TPA: hypothetical protein VLF39_00680 [Candidatus Saccharimonadales bacterium]|nr:hypothetical protein [Candidatus Saccharimonadales bacterium]
MKNFIKKYINVFLVVLLVSFIYSSIYTTAQQVLRMDANDPQIQMAEDTAAKLDEHFKPQALTGRYIDVGRSLAPFIIIYDKSGEVVAGSGYLDNRVPKVPLGVLKHSENKTNGNRVTWQLSGNVRIASVTVATRHYYVLAGRNLREVENRANDVLKMVTFSWIISLLTVGVFYKLKIHPDIPEKKLSKNLHKR